MNVLSSIEKSANRFAPYIEELREFFLTRGMQVGSAEDIISLARQVAAPGPVNEDITSILRSIIFREHEAIPRPDLLRILVIAAAGAPIAGASVEVQQALDHLQAYVGEVIASLRKRTYADDPEESEDLEDELAATPMPIRGEPLQAIEAYVPQTILEEQNLAEIKVDDPLPPIPSVAPAHETPTIETQHEEPHPVAALSTITSPSQLQSHSPNTLVPVAVTQPPASTRWIWVAGLCALLFAVVASLFWLPRSTNPSATAVKSDPPATTVSNTPAPPLQAGASTPASETLQTSHPSPKPSAANPRPQQFAQNTPTNQQGLSSVPPTTQSQPPPSTPASPPASQPPARIPRRPRTPSVSRSLPQTQAANSVNQGSFLVSSGVMGGNLITVPSTPKYPKMADMAGVEGKVILQAVVSSSGKVVAAHVLDGHRLLRGAATNAVRSWRYRPYVVNGKPTDVATIVIVDFHLHH